MDLRGDAAGRRSLVELSFPACVSCHNLLALNWQRFQREVHPRRFSLAHDHAFALSRSIPDEGRAQPMGADRNRGESEGAGGVGQRAVRETDNQDLGIGDGSTGPVPHRPFDRAGRRGQRNRCAEERGGEGQRRADGMRHGVSWCRDVQPRSAATVTGDAPPLLGCTAS